MPKCLPQSTLIPWHLERWHALGFLGRACLERCLKGNASDATGTSEQSWLTLQGGQRRILPSREDDKEQSRAAVAFSCPLKEQGVVLGGMLEESLLVRRLGGRQHEQPREVNTSEASEPLPHPQWNPGSIPRSVTLGEHSATLVLSFLVCEMGTVIPASQ